MSRFIAVFIALCLVSGASLAAGDSTKQAESFIHYYTALCLDNVDDLAALREQLAPMPTLPPEKASRFLNGKEGDAWPIPDDHGRFVLALPDGNRFCAVFARRADTEWSESAFIDLVSETPVSLQSTQVLDETRQTGANGEVHHIAWEWSAYGHPRKLHFMLTTASLPSASTQALGSLAIVER